MKANESLEEQLRLRTVELREVNRKLEAFTHSGIARVSPASPGGNKDEDADC